MNIETLTIEDGIEDDVNNNLGVPVVHTITRIFVETSNGHSITTNQMENGSSISDSSALHDTIINADNTTKDNLNHQRYISQDEGIENNVTSMPIRKKIQRNISSGSLNSRNALCCKVLVIFGVCCIIGCYLIPITLYYVGQTRDNPETAPEFSHEKNSSTAKVCCKLTIYTHLHM